MWKRSLGTAVMTLIAAPGFAASAASGVGQEYPARVIRLIVGFTAGGNDDYVGRIVAARLSERFGQPVIVDNRPGAGGNTGAEILARAAPDGHTLSSVGSITLASGPSLYPKLGYEPMKDFAFIARVALGSNVLFAHPSVPAQSLQDLVKLARAQPKAIRYGTPGVASLGHLTMEFLQSLGKFELAHVPYKGPAPAVTAVLGGEVQVGVGASAAVIPLVQAKRINALVVSGAKRLGPLPTVPTIGESGFPGVEVTNNHGILAPAGTPPRIVKLLSEEINALLRTDEAISGLASRGLDVAGSTPEQFRAIVAAELVRWTRVIKEAKITAN
jgi:tripartite-type tricarboxylate transporter receptor subunit TctC